MQDIKYKQKNALRGYYSLFYIHVNPGLANHTLKNQALEISKLVFASALSLL